MADPLGFGEGSFFLYQVIEITILNLGALSHAEMDAACSAIPTRVRAGAIRGVA